MGVGNIEKHLNMMMELNKTFTDKIPEDQAPPGEGRSIFMDANAMGAKWHMSRLGTTQRQSSLPPSVPKTTGTDT